MFVCLGDLGFLGDIGLFFNSMLPPLDSFPRDVVNRVDRLRVLLVCLNRSNPNKASDCSSFSLLDSVIKAPLTIGSLVMSLANFSGSTTAWIEPLLFFFPLPIKDELLGDDKESLTGDFTSANKVLNDAVESNCTGVCSNLGEPSSKSYPHLSVLLVVLVDLVSTELAY